MNIFEGGKSVNKLQAAVKLKQNSAGVKKNVAAPGGSRAHCRFIHWKIILQFPFFLCGGSKKKNPLLIRLSERPVGKKGFTGNGNMSRGLALHTVSVLTRASCTVARGRY